MNYGASLLRGLRCVLLLGLFGVVGSAEVNAQYIYRVRYHNSSGVTMPSNYAQAGDGGNAYDNNSSLAAGGTSAYTSVNSVAAGTAVQARCQAIGGGGYGAWTGIGVVSAGGGNDFTVDWNGGNTPAGGTPYYWACWSMCNNCPHYIYTQPTVYWDDGSNTSTPYFSSIEQGALAPGACSSHCFTNSTPFHIKWGDTLARCDDGVGDGRHNVAANTNVVFGGAPGNGQVAGSPTPGPVAGNAANPGGGAAAGGTNTAATQHDVFVGADAIINAIAAANRLEIAELERLRTNSLSQGTNADYTDVLNRIKTNTQRGELFGGFAWQLASNQNLAGIAAHQTALNAATNGWQTASNLAYTVGAGAMDYSGATGYVGSVIANIAGTGMPGGYGLLEVTSGTTAIPSRFVDLGSALAGSSFNPYLGGGWRAWLRLLLLWICFLTLVTQYGTALRQGLRDVGATSQIQVNANAGGLLSEIPGVNFAVRTVLVVGATAVLALLPSIITVLCSSTIGLASIANGGGGLNISGAINVIVSLGASPSAVGAALVAMNQWLPLVEMVVFAVNWGLSMMFINATVGLMIVIFKLVGV